MISSTLYMFKNFFYIKIRRPLPHWKRRVCETTNKISGPSHIILYKISKNFLLGQKIETLSLNHGGKFLARLDSNIRKNLSCPLFTMVTGDD